MDPLNPSIARFSKNEFNMFIVVLVLCQHFQSILHNTNAVCKIVDSIGKCGGSSTTQNIISEYIFNIFSNKGQNKSKKRNIKITQTSE